MDMLISDGPSAADPMDVGPIILLMKDGRKVVLTARTRRARFGIWLIRKYVEDIVKRG